MPQIRSAKLIMVENAQLHQLAAVHSFVKQNASAWWHHVPHVWIVGEGVSRGATWWRDNLMPLVQNPWPPATTGMTFTPTVLVLKLPDPGPGKRDWAYWGLNNQNEIGWLLTEYQD
jgi:hypothetical protein